MQSDHSISRRKMLEIAALSGIAINSGVASAFAQPAAAKRIERLDPGLDKIVATSEPIRTLAEGYGSDAGPTEGPVWWKEGGYLLFSDIGNNRASNTRRVRVRLSSNKARSAPTASPATSKAASSLAKAIPGASCASMPTAA